MRFLKELGNFIFSLAWTSLVLLVVGSCSIDMICNDASISKKQPKICKMWFEEK